MFHNVVLAVPPSTEREKLEKWFAQKGASVNIHETTGDFLAQVSSLEPDLVVGKTSDETDEQVDICRRLKTDPATNSIPILMLAENHETEKTVSPVEVLADNYLPSPFCDQALEESLQQLAQWQTIYRQHEFTAEITFLLKSEPSSVDDFSKVFRALWFVNLLPSKKTKHLWLAVREMCMNAIEWGNRKEPERPVKVLCQADRDKIRVVVRDSGPGFDLEKLPHAADRKDPIRHMLIREAEGIREGGFGIMMARSLVDELNYNARGNEVELIKYLDKT